MLKKLLKYDFIAVYRHWWIAAVSILGVSILGGFGIATLSSGKPYPQALQLILGFAVVTSILGYFIFGVLSFILIYKRFFQNFFTDEGYLTFTLPVSISQLLTSKLIVCFVTTAATALTIVTNIFIMLGIGFASLNPWPEVLNVLSNMFAGIIEQYNDFWIVYALEFIAFCILSTVLSCLFVFCCITIASIIAKKAKILVAIAIYYAANAVFSTCVQIFNLFGIESFFYWIYNFSPALQNTVLSLVALGVILLLALLCSLLYTFEHWLLDRKLNLA